MSIHLIQPDAYADLGDAWIRDQLARLTQKHLQFGGHFRIDDDALLKRLALCVRTAKASVRTAAKVSAGDRIWRATVEAIEYCSRLDGHFSHAAAAAVAD